MNQDDLVFLVQMTGGPTAGSNKSVINSHVSKQTHSRRRKEKILQAQWTHDLTHAYGQPPGRLNLQIDYINSYAAAPSLLPTWRRIPDYVSPHTSSHPGFLNGFDLLEGTDAKANEYLRFGREVLEPAIHSVGYRGWFALESPREEYAGPDLLTDCIAKDEQLHVQRPDCFRVFQFAVLAYCASGVAAVGRGQHAHHDALTYTTACMESLREYLDNQNHNIDVISEDLVYRLFRAEVLAHDHVSALAHGTLLRKIFEYKAESSSVRLDVLSNTLYQDSHRFLSSWSRPIFDSEWVKQQYQDQWHQADMMFPLQLKHKARQLSDCLHDYHLRQLLVAAKKLLLQTQLLTEGRQYATPLNFFWFASQCEWIQMCLMDYYLDQDQQDTDLRDDPGGWSSRGLHVCVTLATLYVLRRAKNDVHIHGQALFQGCQRMYIEMDTRLSALAKSMSREESQQNLEAIVFILFVAAIAENHHLSLNSTSNKTFAWRRRLGLYLIANNITTWELVVGILVRFPYAEQELPMPHNTWFQEVLGEIRPRCYT